MQKIDSISEILDKSLVFYKKNWLELAKIIGKYLLMYIAAGIVLSIVSSIFEPIAKSLSDNSYLYYSTKILGSFVSQFVTIALGLYIVFSLPKFLHALDQGHKLSFIDEIKSVNNHFLELFLITLFVTGLVYGGSLALIVPGVYFAIGTMFYPYTVSLEHKHGLNALISSYWETRNKKASIFFRLFPISILIIFCGFLAVAIIGILIAIIASLFSAFLFKLVIGIPLGIALLFFIIFILIPFSMIPQYVVYKNLKAHAHGEVDQSFHDKKKEMFKIFITIGLILYVVMLIMGTFSSI